MHTIELLKSLVEQHQFLAYGIIYLGIVLEGEFIVISAGILAYLGALNFWVALVFIILGGLSKSIFGYALGKFLFDKWNHNGFFKYIKSRVKYFLPSFKHHPFWSVFVSKFIWGANHLVILFSGFERIDRKKYLKAEFLSTLIWAPGLMLLGYFFSYTALQLTEELYRFFTITLILFILYFLFDRVFTWAYAIFEEFHEKNHD